MKKTAKQIRAMLTKMETFETKDLKAFYSTSGNYVVKVGEVIVYVIDMSKKIIRAGTYPKKAHYNRVANLVKTALVTNLRGYQHTHV